MPTTPTSQTLNGTSVDILNAIRNSSSNGYRAYVPKATETNVREIGTILQGNPTFQNEFLSALVNRIGRVIITSKLYDNPWSMFKKGMLEYGETIEDIFVAIAKPFEFDVDTAEKEVFKREKPDVKSVFHILNYQKFYKVTVQEEQLRQAFLSLDGVTDLIGRIVDTLYTGANYDEFLTMKYLIARNILNGNLYPVSVPEVSKENAKDITIAIKGVSNDYTFMKDKYNAMGVPNYSKKENQYVIVNTKFDAIMDVEVLASAFNMDKAEFMGHRVLVDSFGALDTKRLNLLFANDPDYVELTDEELKALDAIPAVLVDENWFMIFDNMNKFTELYNGQGLYWNYWYHQWKTFSTSPYHNASVFVPGTPVVKSVSITPTSVTADAGAVVYLTAKVETDNFASQAVEWSVDTDKATVDFDGKVHINPDYTGTITVTATSKADSSKTASATITVGSSE
jgi:uncharacterized protein YjdB